MVHPDTRYPLSNAQGFNVSAFRLTAEHGALFKEGFACASLCEVSLFFFCFFMLVFLLVVENVKRGLKILGAPVYNKF